MKANGHRWEFLRTDRMGRRLRRCARCGLTVTRDSKLVPACLVVIIPKNKKEGTEDV